MSRIATLARQQRRLATTSISGIVLPRLVDVHPTSTRAKIWQRAPNPDGSRMGARTTVMADREANWSDDDVAKRMDFALRCAFAHGTGALHAYRHLSKADPDLLAAVYRNARVDRKQRDRLQRDAAFPFSRISANSGHEIGICFG